MGVRNKKSEVTLLINHRVGKDINRWMVEDGVVHEVRGKKVTRRAKSSFTLTPRYTLSWVRTQVQRTWIAFDDGLIAETTDGTTKIACSARTGRTPATIAKLRQHYCIPTSECLRHTLVLVTAVREGRQDEQQRHPTDRSRVRHVRSKGAYRQCSELPQP